MKLEYFKSKLTKGQLDALAFDTVKKQLENVDALEALEFAKKLKHFSETLVNEAEIEAKLVWDQLKGDYPQMNYTQGGAIYNYSADPVYADLAAKLKERKTLLDTAVKLSDDVFDSEGVEVPKIPIKNYRKDSINVKI
jgi:hypothetical protein